MTDKEKAELKGPVKQLRLEMGAFISENTGQFVEQCCSLVSTETYDAKGKLIRRENSSSLMSDDHLNESIAKPQYDEKGRLIEELYYSSDGDYLYKNEYSYDPKGHVTSIECVRADETLCYKKILTYDEKENLIEVVTYYSKDKPGDREVYVGFDSYGNWLKNITYVWKGIWKPTSVLRRQFTYHISATNY
jgi:hypothetical protein